jgi:TatD DNase family protein
MTPPRFIDTHCHLSGISSKSPALLDTIKSDLAAGRLGLAIDVGTDPGDLKFRLELMERTDVGWFSIGIYPSHADGDLPPLIAELDQNLGLYNSSVTPSGERRLVAIGEIGLDCYWDYATIEKQIDLFKAQIDLANRYGLPILVHNRSADRHMEETLRTCPPLHGGIMHCFSSGYEFACRMIDYGFLVSFAGNLTYKSSVNLQDTARRLPLERIVLETDSPYLAPVPLRGRTNIPGNVRLVYDYLAAARGMPVEALAERIEWNVMELLGK